jgi:aldose 1-epimerase
MTLHVLANEVWQVGLLPQTGMSTAFGKIKHGSAWLDFMRPTPEASYGSASDCASFLVIPWSNRLRDARFRFRGKTYDLPSNMRDGTAIHGFARQYPWTVERADARQLAASFDSRAHENIPFPFAFSARAAFRLDGPRFCCDLALRNESSEAMPAGFGHHPYFQRSLAGDGDAVNLQIPCAEYFVLENCLPSAPPVPAPPRVDFRKMRPLGDAPIDDCLTGRQGDAPVRFTYAEAGVKVALEFDALFGNVVLYVPPGKTFFAVEPVTNANDGYNLYDRGIAGSGVFVLEPGEERAATFALKVEG